VPERLNPLLNAIAAVRPSSTNAAAIFRETSHSGYVAVNGPLLARNASPNALAVLEAPLSDESLDVDERVEVAHRSLLPVRTNSAVVEMCTRVIGVVWSPVECAWRLRSRSSIISRNHGLASL
jgi:hypothetical protein